MGLHGPPIRIRRPQKCIVMVLGAIISIFLWSCVIVMYSRILFRNVDKNKLLGVIYLFLSTSLHGNCFFFYNLFLVNVVATITEANVVNNMIKSEVLTPRYQIFLPWKTKKIYLISNNCHGICLYWRAFFTAYYIAAKRVNTVLSNVREGRGTHDHIIYILITQINTLPNVFIIEIKNP